MKTERELDARRINNTRTGVMARYIETRLNRTLIMTFTTNAQLWQSRQQPKTSLYCWCWYQNVNPGTTRSHHIPLLIRIDILNAPTTTSSRTPRLVRSQLVAYCWCLAGWYVLLHSIIIAELSDRKFFFVYNKEL